MFGRRVLCGPDGVSGVGPLEALCVVLCGPYDGGEGVAPERGPVPVFEYPGTHIERI